MKDGTPVWRILTLVCAAILCGALTTCTVAIVIATSWDASAPARGERKGWYREFNWAVVEQRWWGLTRVTSAQQYRPGSSNWPNLGDAEPPRHLIPDWAKNGRFERAPASPGTTGCLLVAAGWPCLALAGEYEAFVELDQTAPSFQQVHWCWLLHRPKHNASHAALVPLRPLPSGFAVNTAIYAGVFLLMRLSLRVRPWWRARRHRCVRCGYAQPQDMRAVCPECGWHAAIGQDSHADAVSGALTMPKCLDR